MLVSFSKGHVAWGKKKGTDGVRTRDLRFTRPTPYHLATAPVAFKKNEHIVCAKTKKYFQTRKNNKVKADLHSIGIRKDPKITYFPLRTMLMMLPQAFLFNLK